MKLSTKTNNILIDNAIINACYSLSINEKTFIYGILAKTDQSQIIDAEHWFELSCKEFSEIRNISNQAAHEALKDIEKSLFNRYIRIKNTSGTGWSGKIRWIWAIKDLQNGVLAVKFSPDIIPLLCNLVKYCSISIFEAGMLTHVYAFRLLEIISEQRYWRSQGQTKFFNLKEFREMLELGSAYDEYKILKRSVLNKAIADLREKNIANVSLLEQKSGRQVSAIGFKYEFISNVQFSRKIFG